MAPNVPSWSRRAALRAGVVGLGAAASGCVSSLGAGTPWGASVTEVRRAEGVSVRWQVDLGKRIPVPVAGSGTVFAVSSATGVHALAATDGTRRWHHSAPRSAWFGPEVAGDLAVAVDYETLVAFDTGTGEERWRHEWPREAATTTAPVVDGETVYVGNSSIPTSHTESSFPEDLFAFDVRDGSVRWKRDLAGHDPLSGAPVPHGGTLSVQTGEAGLFALDPADGSVQWRVDLDGSANGGPTAVPGPGVLVASAGETAYGVAPDDGRVRWRFGGVETAPVSDGTTVYVGDAVTAGESTVHALSATDGSERWQFTRLGGLKRWSSLSATDDVLFASFTEPTGEGHVADSVSRLYAVDADGDERWRFVRSCDGFSRVSATADAAFVGGRLGDGTLYALEPTA